MGIIRKNKITKRRPKWKCPFKIGDIVIVAELPDGGMYHITSAYDNMQQYEVITTVGDICKVIQIPETYGHLTLLKLEALNDTILFLPEYLELASKAYQVIYS